MRRKHDNDSAGVKKTVRDIRQATRRQYSAEEKIPIVLSFIAPNGRSGSTTGPLDAEIATSGIPFSVEPGCSVSFDKRVDPVKGGGSSFSPPCAGSQSSSS